MQTSYHHTTTEDELILQGLLYEPDNKADKLILHIHGMGGNFYENRFLDAMSQAYTDNDWALLVPNTRGHDIIADFPLAGETEKYKRIGNSLEIFEECLLDLKAWIMFAEERGYKDIVLQGHSLGAVKVAYYQAKTNDKRISKLILASPPDMVGLAEDDKNHQKHMVLSKSMVQEGKGDTFLPDLLWDWYWLSAKTYLDFGERGNEIDVFNTYDKQAQSILSEISIPVLAFLGGKDDAAIMPIADALEVIKNKATACSQFDTHIVEDAPHSYFGHEEEVADLVMKWLKE
ncbi:MAG: Alpha/beta hydrolase family protein [Microgenomates bacterium OLB23]|nr:MAG: Alpha/beta hydrolase family protein [Microgenomates bacterium OLB23]